MKEKPDNPHTGHRKRKKQQVIAAGIEHLPDHEILEVMLYYAIPTGDTNNLAHKLVDRFGSLIAVLDASYEDLISVPGVGEHTAMMICFFRMISRKYLMKKTIESKSLSDTDAVTAYCRAIFTTAEREELHCIFVDDELGLIGEKKITEGTLGKIELPMRAVAEAAFAAKCNRVLITHNHPGGACLPSRADIDATRELWRVLHTMQIELVDHIVVGRDGEWSIRFNGNLPELW